jgi:hypothetical protein
MQDDIDFATLYGELGLSADCPMASLKQAYRRRVRELHPDLPGASGSVEQLQRLNRLYNAALDFQRRYGRLPGALPRAAASGQPVHAAAFELDARPQQRPDVSAPRPWLRYLLLSGLAGAILLWLAPRHQAEPEMQTAASAHPAGAPVLEVSMFKMGSDRALVRQLQGAPFNDDDDAHWSYGPSWIEFRCGRVSDWYSSPLHPLRVRKPEPDAADLVAAQSGEPRC